MSASLYIHTHGNNSSIFLANSVTAQSSTVRERSNYHQQAQILAFLNSWLNSPSRELLLRMSLSRPITVTSLCNLHPTQRLPWKIGCSAMQTLILPPKSTMQCKVAKKIATYPVTFRWDFVNFWPDFLKDFFVYSMQVLQFKLGT